MTRSKVLVLFGGCSEEHDVSVRSAMELSAHIDTDRYEPIYVGITRSGRWRRCHRPDPRWEHEPGPAVILPPERGIGGLMLVEDGRWRVEPVDVVFPVLHGRMGEDGAVQGLLELSGLPYVGCDVQSSALCMDKSLTYLVAGAAGVVTPEVEVATAAHLVDPESLTYPVFVKPARSGSSFGVSRVDHPDRLGAACAEARRYDAKVLIEKVVAGIEVGCAVLGVGSDLLTGALDSVDVTEGHFRIHQEPNPERGPKNATVTVPAALPAAQGEEVRAEARRIYNALGCRGLARVDMFLTDSGQVVLNEVNTMPGLTPYSRYPRMMAAAGVSFAELIHRCIALAAAP